RVGSAGCNGVSGVGKGGGVQGKGPVGGTGGGGEGPAVHLHLHAAQTHGVGSRAHHSDGSRYASPIRRRSDTHRGRLRRIHREGCGAAGHTTSGVRDHHGEQRSVV